MVLWWESLNVLQRVFACFALPATMILLIQTALLLFGIGGNDLDAGDMDAGGLDGDVDAADADLGDVEDGGGSPEGLALLSVRGVVAFFYHRRLGRSYNGRYRGVTVTVDHRCDSSRCCWQCTAWRC